MPTPSRLRRGSLRCGFVASSVAFLFVGAATSSADTVILVGGKKLEGVTVSRSDDSTVVINRWNSRCPDMTYGIEDRDRIPRAKVQEIIIADPPEMAYRERTVKRLTGDERRELATFCDKNAMKEEAARERRLAKALDDDAALVDGGGSVDGGAGAAAAPTVAVKGDPAHDAVLRRLEREYVKLTDAAALDAQWKLMQERSTTRPRSYLERARRSALQPKGRRDKVPLTVRSKEAPGGTYCIMVPQSYDPLAATPIVIALHGGGPGGVDGKLVTGSGEEAMPFYQDLADEWGFVVVCPTALAPGWSLGPNEPLIDALVSEMLMLFNVDESRIYLTGHSMGGFGTWYWGPHRADLWAAIAPCAGGGGPGGVDSLALPTYIYHGTDDKVVGVDSDRSAAKALLDPEKKGRGKNRFDGVYTELDNVGHGFPEFARKDIFRWFAAHVNDRMKRKGCEPVSAFMRKVDKEEIRSFGDPAAAPTAGSDGDAKVADLVAKLERGGGSAAEAAEELGKRKDAATVKAVARVLRNKKANTDARVAAAHALGTIATPDALDALGTEASADDFKLLDEVVTALGKIGGAPTVEPLQRALKRTAANFDASIQGNELYFTEYEVRLQSFARVADAFATSGATGPAADAVVSALEKECVARVLTPKSMYRVPIDERFTEIPPRARLGLARSLRGCFDKLAPGRAKEILAATAAQWKSEGPLVQVCTE